MGEQAREAKNTRCVWCSLNQLKSTSRQENKTVVMSLHLGDRSEDEELGSILGDRNPSRKECGSEAGGKTREDWPILKPFKRTKIFKSKIFVLGIKLIEVDEYGLRHLNTADNKILRHALPLKNWTTTCGW